MPRNSRWFKQWKLDAKLVVDSLHVRPREEFRRRGPWWMPGRSLFTFHARRVYPIDYIAYMLERMDVEGKVP